ncbi:AAA family ATPase [Roseomonas eburnea]|uniref:AAA family ATPase n=1 Tax=Neoroseomonas eburnea TaxID=1346889 RepID=A0A9X9XGD9_9PROT|nr:AAA family ATPase [Neoroseomonas eburnea]MBR0682775.1 AAA family ATPase [Neoroseomonas eburnea]
MTASFSFRPASRENVGLLIALAGASGSGKTFSALRLARGLSGGGKVAFIDTEARRALHYADRFDFLHADMRPPFRPARFVEAIRAAEDAGASVVIVDSMSHEYDGEGGIMDWADELAANGVKSPGNWKDPKLAHKKLMNALLQMRAHLIFCLRADEKIEIVREGGKTLVRPLGWMPICEKRFMFEMTASFTLIPSAPGLPQFDLPHKLQEQHRGMFPAGRTIGEDAGEALRAWAAGGAAPPAAPADDQLPLLAPDGRLVAVRKAVWLAAIGKALGGLEDLSAVSQWRAAMGPHLGSIAEAGDADLVRQAEDLIERRRASFADDHPGATRDGA